MIRLRVVGYSEDHSQLYLSNKPRGKKSSHVIAIDETLLDTLQEAVYAKRNAARAERTAAYAAPLPLAPSSKIPPREIQRQLRAGATTAQVAKTAEVDISYVEQFVVPVLYEREGIVRDAQTLYQEKPKLGPSELPLGEAVLHNLAARHVRMDEEQVAEAWSATRTDGGPWIVTLTFPFRGRSRTARWRFDQRTRHLTPVNELARDVGWVPPGKKIVARTTTAAAPRRKPAAKPRRKAAAKRSTPRRATPKRTAPRRKAAAKRSTPRRKTTARKTTARKTTARKTTARKTTRRAAPRRRR